MRFDFRLLFCSAWLVITLGVLGCGGKKVLETVPVEGVVRINGKPEPGLLVRFLPDPEQGNDTSFSSAGTTDAQGKYVLEYEFEGQRGHGAAVGWHRVLIADTTQGFTPPGQKPKPPKISYDYASPATTPLKREVQSGEPQTIDFDLKR